MNTAIARLTDVPAGILAGCDRLVHPEVADPAERARQRRFIGVLLAAPLATGAIFALGPITGVTIGALLAMVCGVIAAFWGLALSVSVTGRSVLAEPAALCLAILGVAIAGTAGGASSPLILLAAAIGFETWWIGRSARAALLGIAAAAASLGLYAAMGSWWAMLEAGPAQLWQWLPPVFYAFLSWPRMRDLVARANTEVAVQPVSLETPFDLPMLRLSRSGEIVDASRAAANAFGLPLDVLVGGTLLDRVHLGDRIAFMGALSAHKDAAPARLMTRLRVAADGRAGGSYLPFELELAPGEDTWMVLLRDISDVTELRAELEKARDAAESIDLAKSRFLAAVSHELRTPLNSIIGFSDMLMHGLAGEFTDGRQRDYVGLIRQSGTHLLSVVNAILDVSKIESGAYSIRPELFAVNDAVELCHSMLAQQASEKGLTLTTRSLPDPGEIKADRRAVQQIVLNLVTNAIKFTPSGGSVTVEATRYGSRLRLVVSDTGIGMADEDLQRIGQPFMQVRNDFTRQFDGAGLGLSLVKGLVKLHEGEMSIESAPGEGTVVTVSLPVAGPKNAEAEMAAWSQPATLHRIGGPDGTARKSA